MWRLRPQRRCAGDHPSAERAGHSSPCVESAGSLGRKSSAGLRFDRYSAWPLWPSRRPSDRPVGWQDGRVKGAVRLGDSRCRSQMVNRLLLVCRFQSAIASPTQRSRGALGWPSPAGRPPERSSRGRDTVRGPASGDRSPGRWRARMGVPGMFDIGPGTFRTKCFGGAARTGQRHRWKLRRSSGLQSAPFDQKGSPVDIPMEIARRQRREAPTESARTPVLAYRSRDRCGRRREP